MDLSFFYPKTVEMRDSCVKLTIFFDKQRELDSKINKEKDLSGHDLFSKKRLALMTEFAELANEMRESFKFWSNKKNDYDNALVELVDCFHFILSIGINFGIVSGRRVEVINYRAINAHSHLNMEDVFAEFMVGAAKLSSDNYISFMNDFLALIDTLGFSWDEFADAYYLKNHENHMRQENNY